MCSLPKRTLIFFAVALTLILCVVLSERLLLPSHRFSFLFSRNRRSREPVATVVSATSEPANSEPPTSEPPTSVNATSEPPTSEPAKRGLDAIDEKAPYYVRRNASCLIFSCSPPDYYLVNVGLAVNNRSNVVCDRAHFYVRTVTLPGGATVKPHWCRVALLLTRKEIFTAYKAVMYVDADVVYSEKKMLEEAEKKPRFMISYKVESGRDVLRTSWFLIAVWGDWIEALVLRWALAWRDTYLQDQAVFNELYGCKDVTCVPVEKDDVEIKHCGSYIKDREKCMWETVGGVT